MTDKKMTSPASFETLAETFLGKGFPPDLAGAVSLPGLPPHARAFVRRLLDLMKRSGYTIAQFNPYLVRWLSATVPGMLPGAWGGNIPPITVPGRHEKLDDYVAGQDFPANRGGNIFVDMGCGFPPVTTVDTACRFPDWQVWGVDRSFADYVLYDAGGEYACFNRAGEFLYFQPCPDLAKKALYADPVRTKDRFNRLFRDLFPLLRHTGPLSETVEKDGNRLIRNHIMDFETDNLGFIQSDLMDLTPMNARVFRCMNFFLYFPRDLQNRMLGRIKGHLQTGGLLITGTNSFGIQARYAVYKKDAGGLTLREFAFSPDNLGHLAIMPWFTIHDNDPEALLLAGLARTLRSDPAFWKPFSTDQDRLLDHYGFCRRTTGGFLQFPEKEMPPNRFLEQNVLVWRTMQEKGHAERAAAVLGKAGHDAWVNPAGDIAVRPSAGTKFR